MEFRDNQAVYLQIVDFVFEQILLAKWKPGDKLVSIRELATELEVTPNTVQRSYDFLQDLGIISTQRGVGLFVEEDALNKIIAYKRKEFIERELPLIFRNMRLLKIGIAEIEELFKSFQKMNAKR